MSEGFRVLVAEDEATFGLTVARFLEKYYQTPDPTPGLSL